MIDDLLGRRKFLAASAGAVAGVATGSHLARASNDVMRLADRRTPEFIAARN